MKLPHRLPGMDSYRGRYLYFVSVALIIFCLFSYSSWKKITQASQITKENIINRTKNNATLNAIINQIPTIKVQIYQYSLDPLLHTEIQTNHSITRFIELISQLDISVFDDFDPIELNNFIIQIPIQLHEKMIDLIAIRSNTNLWIPSTRIMSEQLLPLNNEIQQTLNAMLEDTDELDTDSLQLKNKLLQIKTTWVAIVSEFRLIAANRFGFFGTAPQGMDSRQKNLDILLTLLQQQLHELKPLLAGDQHEFIRDIYYHKLQIDTAAWKDIHKEAIALIKQKDWRKDIGILKQIEVLLDNFNKTFISLRAELNKQSINDIKKLNDINQSLTFFIIMMSALALIFSIIGYLIFDRNILQPIARTTRALLMQSQGVSHELNLKSKAHETRNLIEAFNQMSEQIRQRETHLDFMAHHDALTKLANRTLFNERLEHALTLIQRSHKKLAVMLLDLDRFKMINDTLGHLFGDKLLQEAASRLLKCMRSQDTVCRLGGDEFSILLENINEAQEIEIFSKKIIDIFRQPFYIDDEEVHISTSIGIAIAPLHSNQSSTLVRYADIAMYQSKHLGGNQFTWFDNILVKAEQSIIHFENQLRQAITQNQFEIHYQPLIDTQNSAFLSCEALLRWRHPERGLLYPDEFIGILENSEILYDLTCWLIRESQKFQANINQQFSVVPTISINLPALIFQQKNYREKIFKLLTSQIQVVKHCVIEVTEDTLISDITHTSLCLNKLHQQGFKIALDDFGTGQSSLSHLRAFPIDIIKIDKEFIRHVDSDENDANLVSAIISLGHDLGIRVIAEGVENTHQLEFLTARHCHFIQGFLFSRPLSSEQYQQFILQQIKQSSP